jgi:hypothetical protein
VDGCCNCFPSSTFMWFKEKNYDGCEQIIGCCRKHIVCNSEITNKVLYSMIINLAPEIGGNLGNWIGLNGYKLSIINSSNVQLSVQ